MAGEKRQGYIYDRYRARRAAVKQAVKVFTRMADWRWGVLLGNDSREIKSCFGKR